LNKWHQNVWTTVTPVWVGPQEPKKATTILQYSMSSGGRHTWQLDKDVSLAVCRETWEAARKSRCFPQFTKWWLRGMFWEGKVNVLKTTWKMRFSLDSLPKKFVTVTWSGNREGQDHPGNLKLQWFQSLSSNLNQKKVDQLPLPPSNLNQMAQAKRRLEGKPRESLGGLRIWPWFIFIKLWDMLGYTLQDFNQKPSILLLFISHWTYLWDSRATGVRCKDFDKKYGKESKQESPEDVHEVIHYVGKGSLE
jgi:hypothetical protein